MKPETLVKRIIEAIETESPTTITYNGKRIKISKKIIDKYKHCKVRDDIDLERIDKSVKEGGSLPFLPLIFAGLAAAEATAGRAAGITQAINAKNAADAEKSEKRRYKTVKEGLSNLIDKIDTGETKVKHKGNAIFL
ncbi:hypothetical protein LOTGIDRAFT_158583 [Lottia gigantea]|uniref:Uncharacterized protein n=1 Tax=Lottia gigantea TaxID=225164 RepID=V4B0B7_LOTGI|nr:hypothetical protein LOTGIDRAFT_158583 [Lottia gigantea]ESO99491.1 hypothetical protein LOTGIDRAFT_158583 [Lottia gigantea]